MKTAEELKTGRFKFTRPPPVRILRPRSETVGLDRGAEGPKGGRAATHPEGERIVVIPKPGKKEVSPLGVVAPAPNEVMPCAPGGVCRAKEKMVHKGLQIVLETIFEPKFKDCSHGFRPNRSTHSALRPLYLKAHQFT